VKVCPLVFQPVLKPRLWGGRRLEALLGKALPPDDRIGESWELADLEDGQSVVARGPAAGRSLRQLLHDWGDALVGGAPLWHGRFPLLIKFLDAREALSVQVHPGETGARPPMAEGRAKHEAWYVIDAPLDGYIYRGFSATVTVEQLRQALAAGHVQPLLRRLPARPGHCYYLPGGTVHALGAGLLVAEIQTPSDTTYRLYDWDRADPTTGRPRPLHADDALACACLSTPAQLPEEEPAHVAGLWVCVSRLVQTPFFVIERVRMSAGVAQAIPYEEMVVWIVLEGSGRITWAGATGQLPFGRGDTVLLPAALDGGHVHTEADCVWLEVSVPVPSPLGGLARPDREVLRQLGTGSAYVHLNVPSPP